MVDLNTDRIAAWNSNHLPIHETGLPKIVRTARDGTNEAAVTLPGLEATTLQLSARKANLFFSCHVTAAIADADIVFICVNTPTKMYGVGAGASADLGALEAATRTIARHAKVGAVIVEKSTVPCGTARIISDIVSCPFFPLPSNSPLHADYVPATGCTRPVSESLCSGKPRRPILYPPPGLPSSRHACPAVEACATCLGRSCCGNRLSTG